MIGFLVNMPRLPNSAQTLGVPSMPRTASAAPPLDDASTAVQSTPACAHCGQPVPRPARTPFCCTGCETAHAIIHASGLDRFYSLRDNSGSVAPSTFRPPSSDRTCDEFDDPAYAARYVRPLPGGLLTTELLLENVHCSACVWLVERLPRLVPGGGVIDSRLDFRRAVATVTWNPGLATLSAIGRTLHRIGYPPHPARGESAHRVRQREDRRQLVNLGIAGACASNAMLLALALYAGVFDSMDPALAQLFRWVSMGVSLISLLFPGRVFFTSALGALRARTVNLDAPIALALLSGGIWSVIATIRGTGEIYFDSLSVLVFLLLVGRFIQRRQQRRAADAVELLFCVTPTSARLVLPTGEIREAPSEALAPGDLVEVRAGESFPADGVATVGHSSADQSLLTGESRPVALQPGSPIAAGTINLAATMRLRVTASGESTRVGRLMRSIEEASRRRAPIVQMADKAGSWFLAGMLGLSLLTFVAWSLGHGPALALEHAVAVLVVTCPCALGLATPLAVSVAIGCAARVGSLIKGGDALQQLAFRAGRLSRRRAGTIFLDKTGTLTAGRLSLEYWHGARAAQPIVAALERHSAHPVAMALSRDLASSAVDRLNAFDVTQTLGKGIAGTVTSVGASRSAGDSQFGSTEPDRLEHRVVVGAAGFVRACSDPAPQWVARAEQEALARACTPVLVSVDGIIVAVASIGDSVRADAEAAIARMRALGWQPEILSGDHPHVVAAVARQLSISPQHARGGLSPEDKLAIVCDATRRGEAVIMVGDGVNDAAALAAASVGIAVHGGAEASLAAADVYLSRAGVMPVVELIEGSARTMTTVRIALTMSTLYNIIAGGLAVAGMINPLIAALIMPVSSLTALAIALNRRSFVAKAADAQEPTLAPATNLRRHP